MNNAISFVIFRIAMLLGANLFFFVFAPRLLSHIKDLTLSSDFNFELFLKDMKYYESDLESIIFNIIALQTPKQLFL